MLNTLSTTNTYNHTRKTTAATVLNYISGLSQRRVISDEQRNTLARLTMAGMRDGFGELLKYITELQIQHQEIEDLTELLNLLYREEIQDV